MVHHHMRRSVISAGSPGKKTGCICRYILWNDKTKWHLPQNVSSNSHKDWLTAGHTLNQYEKQYLQAFKDAVKAADPFVKKSSSGSLLDIQFELDVAWKKSSARIAVQEQAYKDFAKGQFQNQSEGFNRLMKGYTS